MHTPNTFPLRSVYAAIAAGFLLLSGCGGGDDTTTSTEWTTPAAPSGLGRADAAAAPSLAASAVFVDNYKANVTANTSTGTNPVLALISRMSALWTPGSSWNNGTAVNTTVLDANINHVASVTAGRSAAQAQQAYFDDRRNQNYSVIDGLGPLASTYAAGAGATTTITSIPADATSIRYDEAGTGGGGTSSDLGSVVTLVNTLRGGFSSTTPAKNYSNYPRPWRQTGAIGRGMAAVVDTGTLDGLGFPVYSSPVSVLPVLLPVRSTTPASDGGFTSGHTNAAYLAAFAMAYAMPERYQEILTRASELGDSRILSGMHSPLDVIGGRMMATALAAGILNDTANTSIKSAAYTQAHSYLQARTGATVDTLYEVAHAAGTATDRFADASANKAVFTSRMSYGFAPIAASGVAANVPKGTEVLLETRLPYLSAEQRRVVLKTTAVASGYPLLDDTEGWGRLNLVAAADGYGRFDGDVAVTMNASLGGFNAADRWRNGIAGAGLLTKRGSGHLMLAGINTYSGGTVLEAGTLEGLSATALGSGDVYQSGGTLRISAANTLTLGARYTQTGGNLQLVLGNGSQGRLAVSGDITLAGSLSVSFQGGFSPAVGDVLNLITGASVHGRFTRISVAGRSVTPIYTSNGVQLRIDG